MALPARTSRLTDAVFRTFGETATLRPAAGGEPTTVRVRLRRPVAEQPLWDGEVPQVRPFVEVPHADAASLRKGDIVSGIDGRKWRLAEAPTRPGDGRKWRAAVEDAGAAT